MDSLELQNYEENRQIISLIKHIVYSCWEDIVYIITHDIEVTYEDENEDDDCHNEDYCGKNNGGKKIYSYINEIISRIFFPTFIGYF